MRHIMERGHLRFCGSHVRPDWLQIYAIDRGQLILTASRTGTRSDLFDE
ncbi:type II toxin-antitoxin system YafQ family toxin [Parafannyhessea umbonata]